MPRLDPISGSPLYQQLVQALRAQLRSGALKPGDQLPSERDLMETYHISRNTVRQAIEVLEHEGQLERIHGRGTFVGSAKLKLGLMRLTSFSEDMRERGMEPSSRLIQCDVTTPPAAIAEQLRLLDGEPALLIERLRYADGIPMALNISHFSQAYCPGLAGEDLVNQSIYDILEKKYGLHIARAEQAVRSAAASVNEAMLLEVRYGSPLLIIEGVVYLDNGMPIEHLRSIYRADRYEFTINPIRS